MLEVTSTEFAKRFARYRRAAQREPVAVTHHGQVTEVLLSREEYEAYLALKRRAPRHLWAWELSDADRVALTEARMDARHAHLDALMDD